MANKLLPINDSYAKWGTQAAFQPHGSEGSIKLGDIESLSYTPNLTEIERYSREYAEKTLTRSDVIQKDATLAFTCLSITDLIRSALFLDDSEAPLTQTAVAAKTVPITKVKVGRIYSLGVADASITSFDDGAEEDPVQYIADTHYRLIAETGHVEILSIPAGAAEGAEIVCSGAAILETAGRQEMGIMASNGVRGKLTLWGNNDIGEAVFIEFWDVKLTPSGEVALQGGDDYTQVQLQGRVYADGTKSARFRYGRVTVLQN
ncbi:hypothetical protein [Rhizobium pisi]|uniref:phage tail tube protein n=1 Tax=Rhizobium pisi TaxID=574561 RepID=UPI003CFFC4F9